MESYGSYEVTREIALGQGSTLFSARKAGETGSGVVAIKVFSLAPALGGEDEANPELSTLLRDLSESFASRIEIQKKASASSQHIVPILESGQDERGVWFTAKLYSRSAQKIIAGRVTLNLEDFFHLSQSVVLGALDLKRLCGRSHGNLKPANIFITGAPRVRESQVLLSDPLPGEAAEAARYESADLRKIGELIYQLVRRREIGEASNWLILPIEMSQEWTALFGKSAAPWLALCNCLLDPNLADSGYSLEQLEKDLRLLRPKQAVSWPVLAASAGGLVIGLAALFLILNRTKSGTVQITSAPEAANIWTNGTSAGKTPLKFKLPAGTELRVRAEWNDALGGIAQRTNDVVVRDGQTTEMAFEFPHGSFVITSSPTGAAVEINQTKVGQTPYRSPSLQPGSKWTVLLKNVPGYMPTNTLIVVSNKEQTSHLSLSEQPKIVAGQEYVEFDSEPRGAEILLDGKPFAKTLDKKAVAEGNHEVKGRFRDWPEQTKPLLVRPGQETNVHFYFEHNQITLSSDPPGANVQAGTNPLGKTPLDILSPTGRVTFRFALEGYESFTQTVTVVDRKIDRKVTSLKATLETTNATLLVTVKPEGAEILEGAADRLLTRAPAGQTVAIPRAPGKYSLKARAAGYKTEQKTFELKSKERAAWDVSLSREEMTVVLSSDPPGAEYTLGAKPLDAGSSSYALAWGNYSITARHPRYPKLEPVKKEVEVKKTGGTQEHFRFSYGTLVITSTPSGAAVFEKGAKQSLGKTPFTTNYLLGEVQFDLALNGKTLPVAADVKPLKTSYAGAEFPDLLPNSANMPFVPLTVASGRLWVGQFEVTQAEYSKVMGKNPGKPEDPNLPVTMVSWNDAQEFCRKLTATSRQANGLPQGWEFTLPTVRQWRSFAGDAIERKDLAVIGKANSERVGSLGANSFGLYDVRGNVWEWTIDKEIIGDSFSSPVLGTSPNQPPADPEQGDPDVGFRVILAVP